MLSNIFLFCLIIAGNFLADLFPSNITNMINNSMAIKHLFGILTVMVFIVIENKRTLFNGIKDTLFLYTFFLLLINNYKHNFILVILLLSLSYILSSKQSMLDFDFTKQYDKVYASTILSNVNYNKIQNLLDSLTYMITIVGFISYYGNIKKLKGNKFNILNFLISDEKFSKLPLSFMEGIIYVFEN